MTPRGTPPEIYSRCTANVFKTDLSELCGKCPLYERVKSEIKEQILFQSQPQRDILTDIQFIEYCNTEIKNAQSAMRRMSRLVQQDNDYPEFRESRTNIFIANKEYIKALNGIQEATLTVKQNETQAPLKSIATGEYTKLSHAQIAILYHIAKWPINQNNADEIARRYGQTSGQKLEKTFRDLTSELIRTAKSKYRVKDYETISSLVPLERKAVYDKELRVAVASNRK